VSHIKRGQSVAHQVTLGTTAAAHDHSRTLHVGLHLAHGSRTRHAAHDTEPPLCDLRVCLVPRQGSHGLRSQDRPRPRPAAPGPAQRCPRRGTLIGLSSPHRGCRPAHGAKLATETILALRMFLATTGGPQGEAGADTSAQAKPKCPAPTSIQSGYESMTVPHAGGSRSCLIARDQA
jgi:hypothetical protein